MKNNYILPHYIAQNIFKYQYQYFKLKVTYMLCNCGEVLSKLPVTDSQNSTDSSVKRCHGF